jgi:hypothetical protein
LSTGDSTEAAGGQRCDDVTSLTFTVTRPNFKWRAKDPNPLLERAEDLGCSEYSCLLESPVVIGFLDPTFRVAFGDGDRASELELSVIAHSTVENVKDIVADELSTSTDRLVVYNGTLQLQDGAAIKPNMELKVEEVPLDDRGWTWKYPGLLTSPPVRRSRG